MQLQKADLESLFYTWMIRKVYCLGRYIWRAYQMPKVRATSSLLLYALRFLIFFTVVGSLIRFRLLSETQADRHWERFKLMTEELGRRYEHYKAMGDSDGNAPAVE